MEGRSAAPRERPGTREKQSAEIPDKWNRRRLRWSPELSSLSSARLPFQFDVLLKGISESGSLQLQQCSDFASNQFVKHDLCSKARYRRPESTFGPPEIPLRETEAR